MGSEKDDSRWSLGAWGFGARKRTYYCTGFAIALISLSRLAIAVAIRSFDLSAPLIAPTGIVAQKQAIEYLTANL